MKNILKILFIIFILLLHSNCVFALFDAKAQLAEKINAGKEESNIVGAEISKTKDEINSDKIENINKSTNENNEVGTIKSNITAEANTKINAAAKFAETIKTDFKAKAEVKGVDNTNVKKNNFKASQIENNEGLGGSDIFYILAGISLILCVAGCVISLIIGKFFLRSNKEKQLEQKYVEKSLLRSAIMEFYLNGDLIEKQVCQKIINKYDILRMQFNIK